MTDFRDSLIAYFAALLKSNPAIDAAWLSGSYGRGEQDDFSDIDMTACVGDKTLVNNVFEHLLAAVRRDPQFVFVKTIPHALVINTIDTEWHRADIALIDEEQAATANPAAIRLLFDRNDTTRLFGTKQKPPAAISPAELQDITTEFIRLLGLLPVVLGRKDFVTAGSGVLMLRDKLIRLMQMQNDIFIHRGALSAKKTLTDAQYDLLSAMPGLTSEYQSIIDCRLYLARIFLPLARKTYARHDLAWPELFEKATLRHLRKKLGLDVE